MELSCKDVWRHLGNGPRCLFLPQWWFGVAFAFAGSIHMCRTLDRALLSGGNAGGIVTRGYLFRYFLLAAVLVIVTLTDAMDPLVFFLGYMGLKVTAYLQPITHKLCNRLFREEDPIPLSEEELAAQEGEIPAGQ